MRGLRDPFRRAPCRPGNTELRGRYAELAARRRSDPALRRGDAAFAAFGPDVLCVLRHGPAGCCLLAVNRGPVPVRIAPAPEDFRPLRTADAAALPPLPVLTVPAEEFVFAEL